MPISPPSPDAATSAMVCTGVTFSPSGPDSGPTRRIRPLSRSVTSAAPSGRKAIAHGTRRPLASTVVTTSWPAPPGLAVADGVGKVGGSPAGSGSGSPRLQPAVASSSVAHEAARAVRRRRVRGYGDGRSPGPG